MFEIKHEKGEYTFYQDGELLYTPKGIAVKTKSSKLASRLLEDLKKYGAELFFAIIFSLFLQTNLAATR